MVSKKALVIVGLAAVIAATTGVAFASRDTAHPRGADGDPVSAQTASDDSFEAEDTDDAGINLPDSSVPEDNDISESADSTDMSSDASVNDSSEHVVSDDGASVSVPIYETMTLRILRVADSDSKEELSPRVEFGKFYNDCFLTLYSDSSLELCLNPSAGTVKKATYSINNDILYADFGNDNVDEYPVIYSESSEISYIVVKSGGYDIYFG